MNVPDLEFTVIIQPHTTAGRKWLAGRMMAKNDMFGGAVVRTVECARLLTDEAVADGLYISGLHEEFSFQGPEVDRSAR
jgi:hypothetical protein